MVLCISCKNAIEGPGNSGRTTTCDVSHLILTSSEAVQQPLGRSVLESGGKHSIPRGHHGDTEVAEVATRVVQGAILDHISINFWCQRELMTTRNC